MPRGITALRSEEEFEEAIQSDRINVVLFSAKWCGACKNLKAPYLKLSKDMKPAASFHFTEVDVDRLAGVADKWNADSLPTVMIFRNGKPANAGQQLVGPTAEEIRLACEKASKG